MATVEMTPAQFMDTLTGHEEFKVSKAFGKPPIELVQENKSLWLRSLVFVDLVRAKKSPDPKEDVLSMTLRQIADYFRPEATPATEDEESGEA